MLRFTFAILRAVVLACLAWQGSLWAASSGSAPQFQEIYDLIRTNVAGVSDAQLNNAAVSGLLTELGPKASLVTNGTATNAPVEGPAVSRSSIFDDGIAYLRVARIGSDAAGSVSDAFVRLNSTNKLQGLVLDLRYTDGADYAAAAAIADLFVTNTGPLLNWGNGVVSSHEKGNAISVSMVVLVNGRTAGAAEALAAVLRQRGVGLVLGNQTAGQAMITKDFPLKNGDQLRIATAPVILGDGNTMPVEGIKPDIAIPVSATDEKAYYADSFVVLSSSNPVANANLSSNIAAGMVRFDEAALVKAHKEGLNPDDEDGGDTNRVATPIRLNEAELVRERKQGLSLGQPSRRLPETLESEVRLVSDPALARALDLLKGLAVVRQSHS